MTSSWAAPDERGRAACTSPRCSPGRAARTSWCARSCPPRGRPGGPGRRRVPGSTSSGWRTTRSTGPALTPADVPRLRGRPRPIDLGRPARAAEQHGAPRSRWARRQRHARPGRIRQRRGRLLHSSPCRSRWRRAGSAAAPTRVRRVTAAFGGASTRTRGGGRRGGRPGRGGAARRVVRRAPARRRPRGRLAGRDTDRSGRRRRAAQRAVRRRPWHAGDELVVGHGADWAAAMEDLAWADGEVLVVGSSAAGPIARVFLGSRSSKIVRHSPVPVVVVPRGAIG